MPGPHSRPWVEDTTARLRPYALTSGRTRPTHALARDSYVRADAIPDLATRTLDEEQDRAIRLCAQWITIAELSGLLRVPVQIAKVLISDLIDLRLLILESPSLHPDPTADPHLLEQVIAGLRNL
ncbi:DUF742 domain-containing protein [Streptomyces sp. NPDC055078]